MLSNVLNVITNRSQMSLNSFFKLLREAISSVSKEVQKYTIALAHHI